MRTPFCTVPFLLTALALAACASDSALPTSIASPYGWRFRDAARDTGITVEGEVEPAEAARMPQPTPDREPVVLQLGLIECFELAQQHNRDILLEALNIELRQADARRESAFTDPIFTSNFSVTRDQSEVTRRLAGDARADNQETTYNGDAGVAIPFWTGTTVDVRQRLTKLETNSPFETFDWTARLEIEIRQNLLDGFGVRANRTNYDVARIDVRRAQLTRQDFVNGVSQDVADAYWNLVLATEDLRVLEVQVETASQTLERSVLREEEGFDNSLDVLRARSTLRQRQRDIIDARLAVERSSDALLNAIHPDLLYGYALVPGFRLRVVPRQNLDTSLAEADRELPDVYQHIRQGLADRADLKAAILQIESTGLQVKQRNQALLPRLDVTLTGSASNSDNEIGRTVDGAVNAESNNLGIALSFEVPLGNNADRANLESSKANQIQAVLNARKLETDIIVEIVDAIRDVRGSIETIDSSAEALTLAIQEYEAAQARRLEGFSTSLDVKEAEDTRASAERDLIRARVNLELGRIRLLRATGQLNDDDRAALVKPTSSR